MADVIYCYPDTDVLINKLDIREPKKLQKFERKLTMLRLLELIDQPMKGNFDLKHLQAIHKYIFQDIYDWAGKIRTVDIAKENMFCNVRFLEQQAEEIFGKLREEKYLEGLLRREFVKRSAYYFSEINALHLFREGNGRSQREFIRSLVIKNGHTIRFSDISEEEMIKASRASFLCDYDEIERLFDRCIK